MSTEHSSQSNASQLTYGDYLHVPQLISLQHPQSSPPHHDELLFIITHQTYELWFKQLLHELDEIVANFRRATTNPGSRDEVYEAARLLRRCTEIVRVLVQQFTILETMLPSHFLAFRDKLKPASGFQSEQFREIEFLCGLKDEKLLQMHEATPEMHAALERRLREPSCGCLLCSHLPRLVQFRTVMSRATAEDVSYASPRNCCSLPRRTRASRLD